MQRLGGSAWKFLHNATYVIFWLVVLHTGYFLFIHFTAHFHRVAPPPDWFRLPFLVITLVVISLQALAFIATIRRRSVSRTRAAMAVSQTSALRSVRTPGGTREKDAEA